MPPSLSSYSYSREAASLPTDVQFLHRMVLLAYMFPGGGPAARIRKWFELGAPASEAPTAALRRRVYLRSSLANPKQLFTWATFDTPEWPIPQPPTALELHQRLALGWSEVERRGHAIFVKYTRARVGRIHVPGSNEGLGCPLFREVPAGRPYGLTVPEGELLPLPEVVHDHWPGSGALLAEPELLDPRPIGRVEP